MACRVQHCPLYPCLCTTFPLPLRSGKTLLVTLVLLALMQPTAALTDPRQDEIQTGVEAAQKQKSAASFQVFDPPCVLRIVRHGVLVR